MTNTGFGIYVHWPFCISKCPYCDFNSHVAEGPTDALRWSRAYIAELEHAAKETAGQTATSVFFGGGTPSLMAAETVAAVLDTVHRLWSVSADAEITLEANPSSAEASRFAAFADAGINRISIGVQALDDEALKFLGRTHGATEARRAIALAAQAVSRFSLDLIYARPGQTVAAWKQELAEVLTFGADHVSAYQLTIEKGTPFHKQRIPAADENTGATLYQSTGVIMAEAGLTPYEISNYARPGQESRHNLTYWRAEPYVGVGPGAHGRVTTPNGWLATRTVPGPTAWLKSVETRGHGRIAKEKLSPNERREEAAMMGLRLLEGLRPEPFRAATGLDLREAFEPDRIARLINGGFIEHDAAGLRCTAEGRLRLNAILETLLT